MPLFAFVLTKFSNLPRKIMEICLRDEDQPKRLQSEVCFQRHLIFNFL